MQKYELSELIEDFAENESFYLASEVDAQAAEGMLTANAQRDAVIEAMEKSLRNCLLLAMRAARQTTGTVETDWRHIIRFCAEAGIEPSPLRADS